MTTIMIGGAFVGLACACIAFFVKSEKICPSCGAYTLVFRQSKVCKCGYEIHRVPTQIITRRPSGKPH